MRRLLGLILVVVVLPLSVATDRPVIGILTLPQCYSRFDLGQCIVSSYVKFVEAAGGRVVPIQYDLDRDSLRDLLVQLNGVLLTGGDIALQEGTQFFDAVTNIVEFAFESHNDGEPFPLLGICQGLEAIAAVIAGTTILTPFDTMEISLPMEFIYGAKRSQMFSESRPGSSHAYDILQKAPVTFHDHLLGIAPDLFRSELVPLFRMVAINEDRQGSQFVSAFEGEDAPIFALQFHPEKPIFEWSTTMNISHDADAVIANRYFADVFLDAARKSARSFRDSADEDRRLIYNYHQVYTGAGGGYFETIYKIDSRRPKNGRLIQFHPS